MTLHHLDGGLRVDRPMEASPRQSMRIRQQTMFENGDGVVSESSDDLIEDI